MSRISYLDLSCRAIIVLEYYDGPMTGVGFLADGSGIYFRLVAWDEEQWQRIFAVASVPEKYIQNIWDAFSTVEIPRKPIWCPASDGDNSIRQIIEQAILAVEAVAAQAKSLLLVESRSLVGKSSAVPLTELEIKKVRELLRQNRVLDLHSSSITQEFFDWLSGGSSNETNLV
jgi:hypothetical protein